MERRNFFKYLLALSVLPVLPKVSVNEVLTPKEIINMATQLPEPYSISKFFEYSNGYDLLSEHASNRAYIEMLQNQTDNMFNRLAGEIARRGK